jgi:NAD(P)-dependent dehydrogenase (short-subunit alcohol dehydrogenase family)
VTGRETGTAGGDRHGHESPGAGDRVATPDLSAFDLSGRVALVTGASRGIGQSIAEALGRAGASVAVTSRSRDALGETLERLAASGCAALPIGHDVGSVSGCRAGVDETMRQFGRLDILVNNAGIEEVRPSLEVDEALWDRILGVNLKGAFFTAQAAAAAMAGSRRPGTIVNLCSLTSEVGVPGAVPYGASKSGLLGMTRALAAEWAPLGIRVNAIAPGYFRTAMTEVFYRDDAWRDAMLAKIPQRRFGQLADLQGVAVFLASDASAYVTGQCIAVDGGFLASI